MITLIRDTLDLWQEAERELDTLPPASPDHETAARLVADLRATYERLTAAHEWAGTDLTAGRARIETSRVLLAAIHDRRLTGG